MAMLRTVAMVLSLGWAAAAAPRAAAEIWLPTGQFNISPTPNRCIAASNFKRGKQSLLVALEARPTNELYEMRLYAPGRARVPWDDGKVTFGTVKLESDFVIVRPSSKQGTVIYQIYPNRAELVAAGPSPELKFRGILDPGDVKIEALAAALPLLDSCSADLLERWGYSKGLQQSIASAPKPLKDWASYVSAYDYPMSAIASRSQGETYALIDVEVNGQASNCRVIRSSRNEALDKATCKIVTERARYDPAKNSKGESIRAPLYLTFHWELPRR